MDTPAQLREHLLGHGIEVSLRTLTDWREKGLLPPLERVGRGYAEGVSRNWPEEVIEQAIAAHILMERYGRADEALLGLWFTGYAVDHIAAQQAWLNSLARVHQRRDSAAARRSGGYIAIGMRWLARFSAGKPIETAFRTNSGAIGQLIGETLEWIHDANERDDTALRDLISQLLPKIVRAKASTVQETVDSIWRMLDPTSIFAFDAYSEFVRSISAEELTGAQESLARTAAALGHSIGTLTSLDRVARVRIPALLMREIIGTALARLVIVERRELTNMPIQGTILSICNFLMRVKSTDISTKPDGQFVFTERMLGEWKNTTKELAVLWNPKDTLDQVPISDPAGSNDPVIG